jgi:hypothetical protein
MMMGMATATRARPGYELLRKEFRKAGRACTHPKCLRYQHPFTRPSDWWWHLSVCHPGCVQHFNISERLFRLTFPTGSGAQQHGDSP